MKLYLIGFMGTGKSTVAYRLSSITGIPVVEMDEDLKARAGKPIPEIFREEGEEGFRDREEALLREISESPEDRIVSCGGGVVLREANRRILKASHHVVLLEASPHAVFLRAGGDPDRPLLAGVSSEEEIRAKMKLREPYYRECASASIYTDAYDPGRTAKRIADMFHLPRVNRQGKGPGPEEK